jgi:hypothetical protein
MDTIYRKKENCVSKKMNEEYIIVPICNDAESMHSMYSLNETAAFIWERIDGKTTVLQLADMISNEYNVCKTDALTDLQNFLKNIAQYIEDTRLTKYV